MRIAPYYQKLLQQGLQAAKSLEPITFAGMFDCGVDYLFNLALPLLASELEGETVSVGVDLSGLTTKEEIEGEVCFALSDAFPEIPASGDYLALTKHIRRLCANKKLVLVAYLGQDGGTDPGFCQFLNRLRNLLGWRFSYVLFTTTRLLFDRRYARPLFEKVLKRNLAAVLPLDEENSKVVLANYEERYKKALPPPLGRRVIELAAGNSGLIKALYLQASTAEKWQKVDMLDERLYFRLEGIVKDVSEEVRSLIKRKALKRADMRLQSLERFGYITAVNQSGWWFSSLIDDFLKIYTQHAPKEHESLPQPDAKLLHLTKSQRSVLSYLEGRAGQLVTKDDLAQVLWGENWADKYSDWAIDQIISTLREKMVKIKHEGRIVTKKGEGLIFLEDR